MTDYKHLAYPESTLSETFKLVADRSTMTLCSLLEPNRNIVTVANDVTCPICDAIVKHVAARQRTWPIYVDGKGVVVMSGAEYLLACQRAILALIMAAKDHGLNDLRVVNAAKELIRCRVLECGSAGACNGEGRCPLR